MYVDLKSEVPVGFLHHLKEIASIDYSFDDLLHVIRYVGCLLYTSLGLVTSRDYRISRDPLDKKIKDFMTPFEKLIVGEVLSLIHILLATAAISWVCTACS